MDYGITDNVDIEICVPYRHIRIKDAGTATEDGISDTHPAFVLGGIIYSISENLDMDFGIKGGLIIARLIIQSLPE
ncbi:MAG: hypothetical protein AB1480_18015 [Nitrospirota bacterium]